MKLARVAGLIALVLAALAASAPAAAAPRRSVSASTWLLEGDLVTARVVLPAAEAASLVGSAMPLLSTENVGKYVLEHVSVSAGASPCEATDQGYDIGRVDALSLGSGVYGFEIIFRCPQGGALTLHNSLLFAGQPQHVDFARIERDGAHATQLFTAARQVLSVAETGELPAAGAPEFLRLGSAHVARSVEWCCAMLGFFMLASTRRRLAIVPAALAIGYAAALLLTAEGALPDVPLLGAGMGFVVACSAALLAAQSLRRAGPARPSASTLRVACVLLAGILIFSIAQAWVHRPAVALALAGFAIIGAVLVGATQTTLPDARSVRITAGSLPMGVLAALAGFIDGLVLPGDYERLLQWGEISPRDLAAFDAGALLTETLLLAAFGLAASMLIGRARVLRPRWEAIAPWAGDLAASVFAGVGSFWLLSRLY